MTTYYIQAFDFAVTDILDPSLHKEDTEVLTANSVASMNVTLDQVNGWLKFKTDGEDINDTNLEEDLVFKTNSAAWGVTAFAGAAEVNADGNRALTGVDGLNHFVEYDRIRWLARDMFANGGMSGAYGIDLFENEEQLREEISNRDSNIEADIRNKIDLANGLMMNNTNQDENIGRAVLLHALKNATNRFTNADLLNGNNRDAGFYPFTFVVGDEIVLKVTYSQATPQPIGDLGTIASHSYLYKLKVVAE